MYFIGPIDHLVVKGLEKEGRITIIRSIDINNNKYNVYIKRDASFLSNKITEDMVRELGTKAVGKFYTCDIFLEIRLANRDHIDYDTFERDVTILYLYFVTALWLCADNCVIVKEGIIVGYDPNYLDFPSYVHSIQYTFLSSTGKDDTISVFPIGIIKNNLREYIKFFHNQVYNNKRFLMSFSLLLSIRTLITNEVKIPIYITMLESLFSLPNSNNRETLCLVIPRFIGGTSDAIRQNNKCINSYYNLRNEVIHGDISLLEVNANDLDKYCAQCDKLVRICMQRYVEVICKFPMYASNYQWIELIKSMKGNNWERYSPNK